MDFSAFDPEGYSGHVLVDHARDSANGIVPGIETCCWCVGGDGEEGPVGLKEVHVLRREIHVGVLDKETGGKSSVREDLGVWVGESAVEELEERLRLWRHGGLHACDDLGEGTNGGGALAQRA